MIEKRLRHVMAVATAAGVIGASMYIKSDVSKIAKKVGVENPTAIGASPVPPISESTSMTNAEVRKSAPMIKPLLRHQEIGKHLEKKENFQQWKETIKKQKITSCVMRN